jgi:diguanylate cyclase (GGDEF)-like protein/PAS domain S-box-containing protein
MAYMAESSTDRAPVAAAALMQAIEATTSAIVATDRDGVVIAWNSGAEGLSGYRADEVVGQHMTVAVPEEGREVARRLLEQVAATGEPVRIETGWRRPDDRLLRVALSMAAVRGPEGTVVGTSIIVRDITDRHAAERSLRESEESARLVVELAHDAFVGMDEEGLITGWNRAAETLFGRPREEVLGKPLAETIIPEHLRPMHDAGRRRFLACGESQIAHRPLELKALDRDGREFPVELTLSPVRVGGRWAFNAFVRDLRHRDEAAAAQAQLAAIVGASDDAITATDAKGDVTSWNPGAERLFGFSAADMIGRSIAAVLPIEHRVHSRRTLERVLAGEDSVTLEVEALRADGASREISLTLSPIRDGAGAVVGAAAVAREIGERLRRARTDELTGLPNRQVFVDRLGDVLAGAREEGGEVAVAVVDIDRFHELNEALGRTGGDAVLRGLACTLQGALPPEAMLARIEGDRFGVLLERPGAGAVDGLATALQRVLPAVVSVDELQVHVDASAGAAAGPGDGARTDDLLASAERALRAAKRSRSGFERFDARRSGPGAPSVTLAGEVRRAIERDELVLFFQPQLDLATGRVCGAEGLIRWQHPERGLLPPGAFLPAVERSSLMRHLTVAALDQGLRQARAWCDAGLDLAVSINLSVLNLLDLGIAHDVARLLGEHGVPASLLRLEITEDSLMVDPERSAGVLAGLKAMGVELAVDDFGTGYSSLAYLQRLPVSELKIDRCFVTNLASSTNDAAIVRSTIDMARNLGLRVVAEGVEDEASLSILRALSCDMAQGFHLGRPMPAEDLTARLLASAAAG